MSASSPRRTLVAHASRLGSTAEIAAFIGGVLRERGAVVDVVPVREVATVEPYDHVVVGAAIRYDRWLGEARRFLQAHGDALRERRVSPFLTCLAMTDADGAGAQKAATYAAAVAALAPGVGAASVGRFAGVLDPSGAPLHVRFLLRLITRFTGVEEGDHRDWEAIRAWAEGLVDAPERGAG